MVYGLPQVGEDNWGNKLNDSIEAVKTTADSALSRAIATGDSEIASLVEDADSATRAALSAAYAPVGFVGAFAWRAAPQSIPHNTATAIEHDTETVDTHGFRDAAINPSRLTIPAGMGGLYRIDGQVTINVSTAGGTQRAPIIRINGTTESSGSFSAGDAYAGMTTIPIRQLNDGDYVELFFYHDVGSATSTRNVLYPATWLALTRLGD